MAALKKHDAAGHMAFYQGRIEANPKKQNHIGIIRAFKAAAQKVAGSEIIPITVGISGMPAGVIGFEFAVASDATEAQSKKILAEVKKQTGATLTFSPAR